ncbi:PEP-CTERM sorting domain-containing protein [Alteromonas sediminis]|uniref:PEP-CTERM sorting domain-containing protein n=1 Tax=Alteromonas sediminis TaxID=2259342 RepID=A0A3N5Y1M7_9ALTE|nr:NF038132 family protein [Alteromonas sediminis]RPJ66446.1 PEP-CTERM sorting domain-containing protein [Alteromonas sediminis]
MKNVKLTMVAGLASLLLATSANAALVFSTTGNGGTDGTANGDITASPEGGTFNYVTTDGGVATNGLGLGNTQDGSETVGSVMTSSLFDVEAGDDLTFFFNYITSDGAGYADYAWAQLLDNNNNVVETLFTARTTEGGDTVPGFNMPPISVNLNPSSTPILANLTTFDLLGGDSGRCYDDGCGNTGWIKSSYVFAAAGSYSLSFGVVNWNDGLFDSALLFDNIALNDVVIDKPQVDASAPGMIALLGLGLAGIGLRRRMK